MSKYLILRSLVPYAVSVPDLSVHLRGKGAEATVLEDSAFSSSDLRDLLARKVVSVRNQGVAAQRMWPVARAVVLPPLPGQPQAAPDVEAPAGAPSPSSPSDEMLRVLRGIDEKLGALLTRPSPPPAEVIATHVRALGTLPVPDGLPGAPHPKFIPSTILPVDEKAGSNIKVKQASVDVDVDDSVSALKNLRKGKT